MKRLWTTKILLAVSLALVFSLASPELQASGTARQAKQAISVLGGKALNKVATWSTVAWLLTVPLSGNVLAQSDAVQSTQQAVQTQVPAIAEHQTALRIPLYDAVQRLDYDQLKELLEAGEVDVNARDMDGNTALHYPYMHDLLSLKGYQGIRLFLTHGADPRIKNNAGESPYYDYDYLGGGEPETAIIFAYFVEKLFGINGKAEDRSTALSYALFWADYSGDIELARELVARGADVRIPDYRDPGSAGIRNSHEAAAVLMSDREAFISFLFEQEEGIVNILTQQGKRLLELADKWDNKVVADVLRDYATNIDGYYEIPLYDAVKYLNYFELKQLLERGVVDVNAQDKHGNTALHIMFQERSGLLAKTTSFELLPGEDTRASLILAYGADAKLKNDAGKTIFSFIQEAAEAGEARLDYQLALWGKITHGINGKDEGGRTPLEYALSWANYSGDLALARQLISEGADVRLLNFDDSWNYLDVHNPLEVAAVLVEDREVFVSLLFEQEEGIVNTLKQRGTRLLELADKWKNRVVDNILTEYGVENKK